MSKLKKEHIDKIESLLDITMPHKFTEVTFEISANRQATINTGHEIFTFDQLTPLLIVHYHIEDRNGVFAPQPLHDVRHVILGFQFVGVDGGIIEHEPYVIDADLGIVAMIMPNQYDFSGTVYCHNYLQFYNQRSLDAGLLQMQWTKSWLDMELPQLGQLEISRFTELIMQIHTMAGIAVGELQGQLDQIIPQINSALAEAQRIEDQINDNNIVRQNDFDELRESVEGIATDRIVSDSSWITVDESQDGKLTDKLVEGRTLVNLLDRENIIQVWNNFSMNELNESSVTTATFTTVQATFSVQEFKPNTQYTILHDVNTDAGLVARVGGGLFDGGWVSSHNGVVGRFITVATTVSDFEDIVLTVGFNNLGGVAGRTGWQRVSIYEGDLTKLTLNHTLPRTFTSPSNLSVTSIGENLFDGEWESGTIVTATGQNATHATHHRTGNYIPVQGDRVIHIASNGGGLIRFFEYDFDRNLINTAAASWNFRTLSNTRFIRFLTGSDSTINDSISVAYDNPIPATTPHKSQTQTLTYQNELGEWLPVPDLKGIQVDGNLLVSDEITDTEYIQRVVEVDLETVGVFGTTQRPNTTSFQMSTANIIGSYFHTLTVISNKIPTIANYGLDAPRLYIAGNGILIASFNRVDGVMTNEQVRQYLIDNNYQFLVPLAEPRRYPIRSWDLPSHEPVTHVHIDSGPVSPRTSFKVVTGITQRLRKVENRLTNLENDFRNHIQTLAKAIVQPLEKRDYKSVAMLGFPEEFEIKVEEQEVDVNAE